MTGAAGPAGATGARGWAGRSLGGAIGHRLVQAFARIGGPALCYVLLIPPTCFYFARLHERRRLVARYWKRVRPDLGRWGCLFMAWRHFYSFARILADRFLIATPGALHHRSLGYARLQESMNEPHGCVIISAHVGNWELSCRFLTSYKIGAFNMVMLNAEDPAIAEQVRASLGTHRVNVIDLADPMSASLLIISALNQGETCCMLSDRTAGANDHTIRVPFLGGLARFPTGPFLAAGLTGAMILPAFCLKTSWRSYATVAMPPVRLRFTSRQARNRELAAAVSDWARVLEGVVRRYPLQWHNFYDFWEA